MKDLGCFDIASSRQTILRWSCFVGLIDGTFGRRPPGGGRPVDFAAGRMNEWISVRSVSR